MNPRQMTPAEERFFEERLEVSVTRLVSYYKEVNRRDKAFQIACDAVFKDGLDVSKLPDPIQPEPREFGVFGDIEYKVCDTLWEDSDEYEGLNDDELYEAIEKLYCFYDSEYGDVTDY